MEISTTLYNKIAEVAVRWKIIAPEILYEHKAIRLGVQYIGLNEKHQIALFQDPITGSSFAIKAGEHVESGIRRVRERFGFTGE